MVTLRQVEEQLERIGCNFRHVGRAEIRELPAILMPEEQIAGAVNGRYSGGGALLVITNFRLLLIDRKPLFLTVEDIRFDMIAEIDYNIRLLNSTAFIITPSRKLVFSSWGQQRLRAIVSYMQQKVMDARQQQYMERQFAPQQPTYPKFFGNRVGSLAMQQSSGAGSRTMPVNSYVKMPIVTKHRRWPLS